MTPGVLISEGPHADFGFVGLWAHTDTGLLLEILGFDRSNLDYDAVATFRYVGVSVDLSFPYRVLWQDTRTFFASDSPKVRYRWVGPIGTAPGPYDLEVHT